MTPRRTGPAGFVERPTGRVQTSVSLHLFGFALFAEAAGLLLSSVVAVIDHGRDFFPLFGTGVAAACCGLVLWRCTTPPKRISRQQTFAAVTWTWIGVCIVGAVPFLLSGSLSRPDDAFFESVSGFTATGSTLLSPIESASDALLFWRSLTQWYGGMGMIVLAVAALPFLGVGGQQLLSAESPGPMPDRLAPRVATTALRLWAIYCAITAAATVALVLAGTDLYDGLTHAFTAVSTGGFSRYDASIAHFDSLPVELILDATMLLGATSFGLHWLAAHGQWRVYWRSSEFRAFVGVVVAAISAATMLNLLRGDAVWPTLRNVSFNVISVITTTGFGLGDYQLWVPAAQIILLALMATGSMSGSTSGAIKLFRIQIGLQHAARELRRVRHPRAAMVIRHDGGAVGEQVVDGVMGFLLFYALIAISGVLLLAGLGSDFLTSIGGVATAMGGVGPGFGDAGPAGNFLAFSRPARLVLDALMLIGRLEIYPVLLAIYASWLGRWTRPRASAS
jgi:trk system potassium uptake protein TrkH